MKQWIKTWCHGLAIHPGLVWIPMLMMLGAVAGRWVGAIVMGALTIIPVVCTAHSVGSANQERKP